MSPVVTTQTLPRLPLVLLPATVLPGATVTLTLDDAHMRDAVTAHAITTALGFCCGATPTPPSVCSHRCPTSATCPPASRSPSSRRGQDQRGRIDRAGHGTHSVELRAADCRGRALHGQAFWTFRRIRS